MYLEDLELAQRSRTRGLRSLHLASARVFQRGQGTSYVVFAALVLTRFAWLPQAVVLAGAVAGTVIGYNGLFAFAPPAPK